jgi:AmmeMemoRadiSam system protein A
MNKNQVIKELAWSGIKSQLGVDTLIEKYDVVKEYPEFVKAGATFITLKKDGNLRGCIGSLAAQNELYNDLVINARKAAFNDPRFKPVTKEELNSISLEVSILTPAVLVQYESIADLKSKIEIGVDGVILKLGQNQGTFLPQVWDDLPTFELFFDHLCKKARLEGGCLEKHPQIYKYQVEKIK